MKTFLKHCTLTIFLLLLLSLRGYSLTLPDSILMRCNTALDVKYLSENERNVIVYVNIVRAYPDFFLNEILLPFLDSAGTDQTSSYYISLIDDLQKAAPQPPLSFNPQLYKVALKHAKDMGITGREGHRSSTGKSFNERTRDFPLCAENCDYGNEMALDIVISLLLDEGVASHGHRKNILDPVYKSIAVSIQPHKQYDWNCVMDFAD